MPHSLAPVQPSAQAGRPVSSCQTRTAPGPATGPAVLLLDEDAVDARGRRAAPAGTTTASPGRGRAEPQPGVGPAAGRASPSRPRCTSCDGGARRLARCAGSTAAPATPSSPATSSCSSPDPARRTATSPAASGGAVAPAVPQRAGEDDGDDVDVAGARAGRSPPRGRAGRRRSAAAGRASRRVGASTIRWSSALMTAAAGSPGPRRSAPNSSAVSRVQPTPERPAADDVGEEVDAQPHAGQPDEEDQGHAGRERPVPGARGQQRPGEDQRDGDQRGDAGGVPARVAQRLQPRAALRRSRAAPARSTSFSSVFSGPISATAVTTHAAVHQARRRTSSTSTGRKTTNRNQDSPGAVSTSSSVVEGRGAVVARRRAPRSPPRPGAAAARSPCARRRRAAPRRPGSRRP